MPSRNISSSFSFAFKFLFPAFWISSVGSAMLALWSGKMTGSGGPGALEAMKYVFLAMFIAGTLVAYVSYAPLKRVRLEDRNLFISNYRQEISVPFAQIADVHQKTWTGGWNFPVTVVFREPTAFGAKITFVPRLGDWGLRLPHPVVDELRRLAGLS